MVKKSLDFQPAYRKKKKSYRKKTDMHNRVKKKDNVK